MSNPIEVDDENKPLSLIGLPSFTQVFGQPRKVTPVASSLHESDY